MKVIIAGSRGVKDYATVLNAITDSQLKISCVLCGEAAGVDTLGKQWAEENGVTVQSFKPNWKKYGRGAGYATNKEMVDIADALIAIWDGKSKGTSHVINAARKKGITVVVFQV